MKSFLRNYKVSLPTIAVMLAGLAWVAFGFFGVHTLFFDKTVDEAGPVFAVSTTEETTLPEDTAEQAEPVIPTGPVDDVSTEDNTQVSEESLTPPVDDTEVEDVVAEKPTTTEAAGSFVDGAHTTNGDALVLGNGTGQRFLRFENFKTDNGPDLNVYLVNSSAGGATDFIDLGNLKGNIGDQNYEIPENVDLDVYDRIEIWCVRFSVGFGNATLSAS